VVNRNNIEEEMKMKKIYGYSIALFCLMSLAILNTACTQEELAASGKAGNFEATATLPGNAGTRVAFTEAADGSKITPAWESGDQIYVMQADAPATNASLTIAGVPAAGEDATFGGSFAPASGKKLQAFYGCTVKTDEENVPYLFTEGIENQDGTLASAAKKAVMYAETTYTEGTVPHFAFKNICSILKLVVTLPDDVTKKITSVYFDDFLINNGAGYDGKDYQKTDYCKTDDFNLDLGEGIVPDVNHRVTVYMAVLPIMKSGDGGIEPMNLKNYVLMAKDADGATYIATITADQEVEQGGMYTVNLNLVKSTKSTLTLPENPETKDGYKTEWTAEDANQVMILPMTEGTENLSLSRSRGLSNLSIDKQSADFLFDAKGEYNSYFYPYTDKSADVTLSLGEGGANFKFRLPKYDFSTQGGTLAYAQNHAPIFFMGDVSNNEAAVIKLNLTFNGVSSGNVNTVNISLQDADGKELLPASFTICLGEGTPFITEDLGSLGVLTANYPTPIHLVSHPSADGTLTVYFITLASYQTSTLDTEGKNTFVSKTASATAADLNGLKVTAQIDTTDDGVSNFGVYEGTVSVSTPFESGNDGPAAVVSVVMNEKVITPP